MHVDNVNIYWGNSVVSAFKILINVESSLWKTSFSHQGIL